MTGRLLRRALVALAAASLVLVAAGPGAGATTVVPYNAITQNHCNYAVCVGAWSVGGHGPDIIAAQVETRNLIHVAVGTVIYLNYGPNPTLAKQRIPLGYCIAESTNVAGCTFGLNKVLNVGWVLCGQIVHYVGYPCIWIGGY